jgi:hypothetical protein
VRCTLRPPEPPRGHGIGGPSASAPLCVSDRLGGMPLCGRLRDGPLRPPLPPPSPAGMTRRSPGAARPTSTSFFAGRRARDGAAATAAAFAVARRRPNATSTARSAGRWRGARPRHGPGCGANGGADDRLACPEAPACCRPFDACPEVVRVRARAGPRSCDGATRPTPQALS